MELSDKTLQVLKNYASINPNLVIGEGDVVKTVSEARNVLSCAQVDVQFPRSFGIYDLNEFLSVLSLVDQPSLTFSDHYVTVSDGAGRSRTKYFYSDPEILTAPTKDIIMPPSNVTFVLDRETLQRVRRAASVLGHSELSVSANDNVLTLNVIDINNKTSNVFSIDIDGQFDNPNFEFIFNISNLKMVDGDYDVSISSKLISHFVNKQTSIEYWVALEKTSTYGE